jgi:hypothetical protein
MCDRGTSAGAEQLADMLAGSLHRLDLSGVEEPGDEQLAMFDGGRRSGRPCPCEARGVVSERREPIDSGVTQVKLFEHRSVCPNSVSQLSSP